MQTNQMDNLPQISTSKVPKPRTHTCTHNTHTLILEDYLRYVCVWRSSLWPEEAAVRPAERREEFDLTSFLGQSAQNTPPRQPQDDVKTNPAGWASLKLHLRRTDRWTPDPSHLGFSSGHTETTGAILGLNKCI